MEFNEIYVKGNDDGKSKKKLIIVIDNTSLLGNKQLIINLYTELLLLQLFDLKKNKEMMNMMKSI